MQEKACSSFFGTLFGTLFFGTICVTCRMLTGWEKSPAPPLLLKPAATPANPSKLLSPGEKPWQSLGTNLFGGKFYFSRTKWNLRWEDIQEKEDQALSLARQYFHPPWNQFSFKVEMPNRIFVSPYRMVEEDFPDRKEIWGKGGLDRETRLHTRGRSQHKVFSDHCIWNILGFWGKILRIWNTLTYSCTRSTGSFQLDIPRKWERRSLLCRRSLHTTSSLLSSLQLTRLKT